MKKKKINGGKNNKNKGGKNKRFELKEGFTQK